MTEYDNNKENDCSVIGGEQTYESTSINEETRDIFSGGLTIASALQKLRSRLLDLTNRNRLLNYKPSKGRTLQFVNVKNLNEIYESLIDSKKIFLSPVPEPQDLLDTNHKQLKLLGTNQDSQNLLGPTSQSYKKRIEAREHAKLLGIDISCDLTDPIRVKATGQRKLTIQTLFYPDDLEKLAKKISSEARSAIEETGTNILYIVFGFLEFYDSEQSNKPLLAPILSMPVSLMRDVIDPVTRVYRYYLVHNGEDVIENITLREKLKQEFRIHIPEIGEDDTPEDYFKSIQKMVKTKPRWKVRRQLSLAMLSFGKLVIWADLDPLRWPDLLNSSLLQLLFEGEMLSGSCGNESFDVQDYAIDTHPQGNLPIVYDADSSQHSALIDALSGKNMVINGPPGTGKSQTITNIITASLSAGKKVLFVSEKLEALKVVKHRLDKANLGHFCLELHSNKTQKKSVLEDIHMRLDMRFKKQTQFDSYLATLSEQKRKLQRYAELISMKSCNELNLTIDEIFWAAESKRQKLGVHDELLKDLILSQASTFNHTDIEQRKTILEDLALQYIAAGGIKSQHAWHGILFNQLYPDDEGKITQIVENALLHCNKIVEASTLIDEIWKEPIDLSTLLSLAAYLDQVPPPPEALYSHLLEAMFPSNDSKGNTSRKAIDYIASNLQEIRIKRKIQCSVLRPEKYPTLDDLNNVQDLISHTIKQLRCFEKDALDAPLRDLVMNHVSLVKITDKFEDMLVKVQPQYEHVDPSNFTNMKQALDNLSMYNISETSLETLKKREQGLYTVVHSLREALDCVSSLANRWKLPFDGSQTAIAGLVSFNGISELLATSEIDNDLMDRANSYINHTYADRSVHQIENDHSMLQSLISTLKQSLIVIESIATETGHPFNRSTTCISELLALASISSSAPNHLLHHRRHQLEHPGVNEVISRLKSDYTKELNNRSNLAKYFYLNDLPSVDELRLAARVFRRGESLFNIINSDWRKAKKLITSLSCTKINRSSADLAHECLLIADWIEHRSQFNSNFEYKESFGELFKGVETDIQKIDALSAWYKNCHDTLLSCGTMIERTNLTELDARKMALLAARTPALLEAERSLQATLEQIINIINDSAPLPEYVGWQSIIDFLNESTKDMSSIVNFFKPLVQSHVTPLRAIELLEAKLDLINNREFLLRLASGNDDITVAAGLEFSNLAEQSFLNWNDRLDEIEGLISLLQQLNSIIEKFVPINASPIDTLHYLSAAVALDEAVTRIIGGSLHLKNTNWQKYREAINLLATNTGKLISMLRHYADDDKILNEILFAMTATMELENLLQDLRCNKKINSILGQNTCDEKTDISGLFATWDWGSAVAKAEIPIFAKSILMSKEAARDYQLLNEQSRIVASAHQLMTNELGALRNFSTVDLSTWRKHSECDGCKLPADIVKRLRIMLDSAEFIIPWAKYLAIRQDCISLDLHGLITLLESGHLPPTSLSLACERIFYVSLGKEVFSQFPELSGFSGESHDRLRTDYRELDKKIIKLTGLKIAHAIDSTKVVPVGKVGMRASDFTEMHLVRRELGKTTKHIPIRQLIKRAGRCLQALKPCFMMGPLAVAQYLEPGSTDFDVIVMDEASQLRPEDALGAIARGKQLIVVGDPKQLPPTSFFDRMIDQSDEDEDGSPAMLDGSESILDICQQLFNPVRTLKWHYRSQHESLIAFSNFHFYRSEMIVFPSPYERGKGLGVIWKFVKDGIYKDRRNIPEALRIVDEVINHMIKHKEESLAVICLNQTQRDLIQDLLDKRLESFEEAQSYIAEWEERGLRFFIKNLENVQGDERDVIFISTTFGKAPGTTKPRQNFGPISRPTGWRRLNVLFTRSRKRLVLFTSMQPEDIVVDEKTPVGTRALRDYLDYVKRGILVETDYNNREPDSDFEISVANVLQNHGYMVKPQLGVANFFLDLVVYNPDRPGEFLAAIECDGATYHSSASARDRDRIRQEILESLGWNGRIYRIWSTDWFYNPRTAIRKLLAFIDNRRQISASELLIENEYEDNDDFANFESSLHDIEDSIETPNNIEWKTIDDDFVDIGDTITYCFVDSPRSRHKIRIVEKAANAIKDEICEEAPLALALIGLEVGEVGLLSVTGHQGRKVRVIKIER